MNFNTAIFLVNDKCRGVTLAWEWCDHDGKAANGQPVKTDLFKTFDPHVKKGDLVLGETQSRHKLCVYRVVETDVEVDLETTAYIPWIVERISGAALQRLRDMETEMVETIKRKDKERRRAELAQTMLKDYGEEIKNLAAATVDVKALTSG